MIRVTTTPTGDLVEHIPPRRGRPPLPDPRTTRVVVRVTPEEAEMIRRQADAAGRSVSEHLRRLALG